MGTHQCPEKVLAHLRIFSQNDIIVSITSFQAEEPFDRYIYFLSYFNKSFKIIIRFHCQRKKEKVIILKNGAFN